MSYKHPFSIEQYMQDTYLGKNVELFVAETMHANSYVTRKVEYADARDFDHIVYDEDGQWSSYDGNPRKYRRIKVVDKIIEVKPHYTWWSITTISGLNFKLYRNECMRIVE